jgi:hypothetical protein
MNWKIGQKVVCINQGLWKNKKFGYHNKGPKYGEVCEISAFIDGYLLLIGYEDVHGDDFTATFSPTHFRPLLGKSAKSELVSSFKEVTETSDLPISVPQTETV